MEPKNGTLENDFPFQLGDLIFNRVPGVPGPSIDHLILRAKVPGMISTCVTRCVPGTRFGSSDHRRGTQLLGFDIGT